MTKLRWQYGIIAGIFLAIFASYPQLKMRYMQGEDWQGHYAYNDIDEVAYASYLKALIDGRPRKNDPYSGRDESSTKPQPESLFSIQFAAPYTIAIPARILGISASTAMILTGALAGFFAALGCFWVIGLLTDDSFFAMTGSLVVLCGGALAAGEGAIGEILGTGVSYPYFPFLRRYIPAVPFPVFFALLATVWLLLTSENWGRRIVLCLVAFACFSFLVFSYFYIWTTASAWLFCVAALWLLFRPKGWLQDFQGLIVLGVTSLAPLVLYAYLLSQRASTTDSVQLLVHTRQIDFWRFPEYISVLILVIIFLGILLKKIDTKDKGTIFSISLALVPIVIFNQQLFSGRSLQPIHYQVFIGNYVSALALVATIGILLRKYLKIETKLSKLPIALIAILAIGWGFVECFYTVRVLDRANVVRDKGIPIAKRLTELSKEEPDPHRTTVFSIGTIFSDDAPTLAPQNVLWSRHQHIFAGLSARENKERYYRYLYYQNLDEKWLKNRLIKGDFVSMITLFGWARHSNRLSAASKPLTRREINEESKRFGEYIRKFGEREASNPKLSYIVVPKDWKIDFTNLDKWYKRDDGETIGIYKLYKIKLRNVN